MTTSDARRSGSATAGASDFAGLKAQHREQKRALIERAAAAVFAEKGIRFASMADIAREAGISTSAIYLYFTSREELLFATVLAEIDELEAGMTASVDPGADPPTAVRRMVGAYFDFYRRRPEGFRMLMAGLDPEARRKVPRELMARYDQRALDCLSLLHGVVKEGIADGTFRATDPWRLTHAIWGAFHGILRLAVDQPDPTRFLGIEVEALVTETVDALIDGISTDSPAGGP